MVEIAVHVLDGTGDAVPLLVAGGGGRGGLAADRGEQVEQAADAQGLVVRALL